MRPAGGRSKSQRKPTSSPLHFRARENKEFEAMAIYHLSAKINSRKSGRSATGAAAYRAGEEITDERTGAAHDYTRKRGVEHAEIVLPSGTDWTPDRAELWNAVEAKNKRQDAQVAREFVVALPDELDGDQRRQLAIGLARHIADTYRVAADLAIHAPGREGDHRNHHAHILTSTNILNQDGTFGNKARALDAVAHDRNKGDREAPNEIEKLRGHWADLANQALERAGLAERIDHRSLEAQGIDRAPTQHMGPAVSGLVRRGENSEVARRMGEEANARLFAAQEIGRIERELAESDCSILDLSGDLAKAKADRDRNRPTREEMDKGITDSRRAYEQHKADQAAQQLKAKQEAERANIQAQKVTPPAPPSSVARQEPKEAKRNSRNVQMAKSFANDTPVEAVTKYPELAGAYATVAALEKKAEADGLDERQRAIVSARVRELVANSIERGEIPNTKIRKEKEVTQTRSNKRDYSR